MSAHVLPTDDVWLGVFQGGGAKGIAYAGALAAMESKGQWFSAVAGASAGALTAALVAAGYRSNGLQQHTESLLASIQPASYVDRLLSALPGLRALVRYDSAELERRIEDLLRTTISTDIGATVTEAVTFTQLHESTGLGLYVVATDSTTALPVLFCRETTPNLSVSAAVVASCALPVAFEPRYALVSDPVSFTRGYASTSPLRRLQDGGVWANFPAFVFTDKAFRRFHGLAELSDASILGFTLSDPRVYAQPDTFVDIPKSLAIERDVLTRHRRPPKEDDSANTPLPWPVRVFGVVLGAVLLVLSAFLGVGLAVTSDDAAVRWVGVCLVLVAVAAPLLLSAIGRVALTRSSLVVWLLGGLSIYTAFGSVQAVRNSTLPPWAAATVGLLGVTCAVAILIGGLLFEKTRTAIFSGATDVFSVLMLQAVTPAPWVDTLDGSYLVVVPSWPLKTTTFKSSHHVSKVVIPEVIRNAEEDCLGQLEQIMAGSSSYQARISPPLDASTATAVAALMKQIFGSGVSRHRL